MRKSAVVIITIVSIFAIFVGYNYFNDKELTKNSDGIKFKEEYEKLNDTINSNNNKKYPKMSIKNDNVIKYSTYDEVLQIIKEGTGVIYLGFPECPWCRNAVPVLLEAASESELDTIYYLNIQPDRDLLVLDSKNKVRQDKKGTDDYYKLVDALSKHLDDYIINNGKGIEVNTNTKRIYLPTVIFVKDGEIQGIHVSTVDTQKDPYVSLTDRQEEELLIMYINLMNMINGSLCDENC